LTFVGNKEMSDDDDINLLLSSLPSEMWCTVSAKGRFC